MSSELFLAVAGNAAGAGEPGLNVEDVFSTYLYEGNGGTQSIQNGIALGSGDPVISLQGYTFTSIGSAIHSSYPLSNINDGVAETSNGQNLTYVADGNFDVYVDLQTPQTVIAYLIAPQGGSGLVYNTPLNFKVHGSSDGSNWTEIEYFQSISTGSSNWTAGTYREFSFTNTTAYRYWRFDHIGDGSNDSGVAISELKFKVDGGDTEAKGGLVWVKERTDASTYHGLVDTERGNTKVLYSNDTSAEATTSGFPSFNNNGFSVALDTSTIRNNDSGDDYVSWTFRKAPKFFDVVTYTGDGTAGRTISHNLGSTPGCIIVKNTTNTNGRAWYILHRSLGATKYLQFDTDASASGGSLIWNDTEPTDSVFTVGSGSAVNGSGDTMVAYLFAHNDGDGGFGENGDQDIIKCGSYTGTGAAGNSVDIGFEPQFFIHKAATTSAGWYIHDNMRGLTHTGYDWLEAQSSAAETNGSGGIVRAEANGVSIHSTGGGFNSSGQTYIYIAIRRGPMKTPESGTEVFAIDQLGQTSPTPPGYNSPFPVDLGIQKGTVASNWNWVTRLLDGGFLESNTTDAYAANAQFTTDFQNGFRNTTASSTAYYGYMFRRAPGFFDVVAYTGDNVAGHEISHNLGVAPEMMIIKNRSGYDWIVYHQGIGNSNYLRLNAVNGATSTTHFDSTTPTESVFTVGDSPAINSSSFDYIAYLFATLPGISKVGTYTGNGTGQTIDCGFSAGARFVLIKRTDLNSNWNLYDTERGIVAGNDPRLELDSTDAEDTGSDDVDPDSSGFAVTSDAFVNTNGASYAFLAIA